MRSLGIFQTAAFVLGSRMNESACKAFKRRISVPYSSLGIRDTSPICFHSQTFLSLCRSLRSICLMWGMNPLFFREKLHICEFPPHCGCLVRGHLCLCYPPCCHPFMFAVEELFSFHVFFKGDCSICSYRFGVSMR